MNRHLIAAAALATLAACSRDASGPLAPDPATAVTDRRGDDDGRRNHATVHVTSSADAGPGSLRAAVELANASPSIGRIVVKRRLPPIVVRTPIVYTGSQDLTLDGNDVVIDGSQLAADGSPARHAPFVSGSGADLELRELTVRGSTGNGLIVDVPEGSSGAIAVTLERVTVKESRLHGVIVNEQREYFANPETLSDAGTPASLRVRVTGSRFIDNGFGGLDFDGLRVNEGGPGSLFAEIEHAVVEGNGADGVELDERGDGDARFAVRHTAIDRNGFFSSDDFDDGIDVDEAGPGSLVGVFFEVRARGNAEQGVDLNENGLGDLRTWMHRVTAEGNAEEGIELEEDDDFDDFPAEVWGGDIHATMRDVTANGNGANDGDAGLKIREKFDGRLVARVHGASTLDNHVSGIQVREGEAGDADVTLESIRSLRNAGDGIEVRESGAGVQGTTIARSESSGNGGAGARLRGEGTARLIRFVATGNAGGEVVADPGIVVTRTPCVGVGNGEWGMGNGEWGMQRPSRCAGAVSR